MHGRFRQMLSEFHEKNASANRGACVQNCRRPYQVTDLETGNELLIDNEYMMSPKIFVL